MVAVRLLPHTAYLLAVGWLFLTGCGDGDDPAPPLDSVSWRVTPETDAACEGGCKTPVCSDGQTKECLINLPTHGSVESCLDGIATCVNSTWGPCEEKKTK